MKAILLSLAMINTAQATTLGSVGCSAIKYCGNVPNDAGQSITLSDNPAYSSVTLVIDGQVFSSPTGSQTLNIEGLTLINADTSQYVILSAYFTTTRKCYYGRGAHCSTIYTLTNGTIQR